MWSFNFTSVVAATIFFVIGCSSIDSLPNLDGKKREPINSIVQASLPFTISNIPSEANPKIIGYQSSAVNKSNSSQLKNSTKKMASEKNRSELVISQRIQMADKSGVTLTDSEQLALKQSIDGSVQPTIPNKKDEVGLNQEESNLLKNKQTSEEVSGTNENVEDIVKADSQNRKQQTNVVLEEQVSEVTKDDVIRILIDSEKENIDGIKKQPDLEKPIQLEAVGA